MLICAMCLDNKFRSHVRQCACVQLNFERLYLSPEATEYQHIFGMMKIASANGQYFYCQQMPRSKEVVANQNLQKKF